MKMVFLSVLTLFCVSSISILAQSGQTPNAPVAMESEICSPDIVQERIALLDKDFGYVESQLIVTAALGVKKEDIQSILSSVNAEIVGYIEVTGQYQVKFKESKTYDELMAITNTLTAMEKIDYATLNMCSLTGDASEEDANTPITEGSDSEILFLPDTWEDPWSNTALDGPYVGGKNNSFKVVDLPSGFDLNIDAPDGNRWWAQALDLPTAWILAEHRSASIVKVGIMESGGFDESPDIEFQEILNNAGGGSHGLHVAGIIGAKAQNGQGIRGAGSLNVNGSSNLQLYGYGQVKTEFDQLYGIAALLSKGVKLINMSLEEDVLTASAYYDSVIRHLTSEDSNALAYAERIRNNYEAFILRCESVYPDFLLVHAAGNMRNKHYSLNTETNGFSLVIDENGSIELPDMNVDYTPIGMISDGSPARDHIVIVGSLDLDVEYLETSDNSVPAEISRNYTLSGFSLSGADIYAPGGYLDATYTKKERILPFLSLEWTNTERREYEVLSLANGGTKAIHGTSQATPMVTGIAALLWSLYPDLTSAELRSCLLNQGGVTNRRMNYVSLPMADARAALLMAEKIVLNRGRTDGYSDNSGHGFLMGSGFYTQEETGNKMYMNNCRVTLYDAEWNLVEEYTQGDETIFTLIAPPGTYNIVITDEVHQKLYMEECEIHAREVTIIGKYMDAEYYYEAKNRLAALLDYAIAKTIKSDTWYASGTGSIGADMYGVEAIIDYAYDLQIKNYDKNHPELATASGDGYLEEYGIGLDYHVDYANKKTHYTMGILGMEMDLGWVDTDPGIFDYMSIEESHLTDILQVDDTSFTVRLDASQLNTLRFNSLSIADSLQNLGFQHGTLEVQLNQDRTFNRITVKADGDAEYEGVRLGGFEAELNYFISGSSINKLQDIPTAGDWEDLYDLNSLFQEYLW